METKKYRYVKFEKLSEAVGAWENGVVLWCKTANGWVSICADYRYFAKEVEYYHREEIKLFECWVVLDDKGCIINSYLNKDIAYSSWAREIVGDFVVIKKMREVIED